jgi:hypothetical protein
MIAPLRNPSPRVEMPSGPRHIGSLLPAVLARYGIVISEAELAAFQTSTPKTSKVALQPAKLSSRRFRHGLSERSASSQHCKMVQLPLFTSSGRSAASGLAIS